jgi:hypothetical protein
MDRFLLLWLAVSMGGHAVIIAHLPQFGTRDTHSAGREGIEVRYVDGIVDQREEARAIETGMRAESSPSLAIEETEVRRAQLTTRVLHGTGEIFKGSVKQELTPLFPHKDTLTQACRKALDNYKCAIEQILARESRLSYPRLARESGREAKLNLRFCLKRDGSIESFEISSCSGDFGKVIVAGLERASCHFPPFPGEIGAEKLVFFWPVRFDLY